LYASLIGFDPRRLQGLQGMSSLATDLEVYAEFSSKDEKLIKKQKATYTKTEANKLYFRAF